MQLSTAMPIVMAAMVIVIRSRGIDKSPIEPSMTKHAITFGIIAAIAVLNDLNKKNNIKNIPNRTSSALFYFKIKIDKWHF